MSPRGARPIGARVSGAGDVADAAWTSFTSAWSSAAGRVTVAWDDAVARLSDAQLAVLSRALNGEAEAKAILSAWGQSAYLWALGQAQRLTDQRTRLRARVAEAQAANNTAEVARLRTLADEWVANKRRYDQLAAPILAGIQPTAPSAQPPGVTPGTAPVTSAGAQVGLFGVDDAVIAVVAVAVGIAISIGAICWFLSKTTDLVQYSLYTDALEKKLPVKAPGEASDKGDDFSVGAAVGGAAALIVLAGGVYLATRTASGGERQKATG